MPVRAVLLVCFALAGAGAIVLLVGFVDVRVIDDPWRSVVVMSFTIGSGVAGAAVAVASWRRPEWAADAGVVAAGVLLAAMGVVGLHGTRWGWCGLFSDSAFRTQMATRYAETPALVDYGYRGLPAYYPPGLGWVQGRLADATGMAGWEAVKPVQVVVAALVPVAAYLLWRPVVGALSASAIASLVTVWTAHPQKPDEWLVLACLLPWWLLAVRDIRQPGAKRWSSTRLGVVLGLLLLTHTYWFLPFGIATLFSLIIDAIRRRSPLPWRRALAIGFVGLAVSAVFWAPAAAARLRLPADSLQMRYAHAEGNIPPVPMLGDVGRPAGPVGLIGLVGLIGVGWLMWSGWSWMRTRRPHGLAAALTMVLSGALATLGLGAIGETTDVGLLAFKAGDVVTMLLLGCGVLGVAAVLGWMRTNMPARVARAATVVLVAAAAATAGHHAAVTWATGPAALVAQTTRYPDGSMPPGGAGHGAYLQTLFVDADGPSVLEIRAAWHALRPDVPMSGTVLVTSQVDLLATTPVYGFLAFKSIYSHPNGQFEKRVALLQRVADCPTSACAAHLLRSNPFDAVDGLVLRRDSDRLVLPFMVDDFPDRTRLASVAFPDDLLSGPEFVRRELDPVVVIALRP